MKFARIKSVVLSKALQSKEFKMLRMYLSNFKKEGEYFITSYNNYCDEWSLKSTLADYLFNERESESLWELAEKTIGSKKIDLTIIKVVEV